MNDFIKYTETFETINQTSQIKSNCNSLTVINTGTATAQINGVSLNPGQQFVVTGNFSEFNTTEYRLSFVGPGIEQVTVIRKIYL